MLRALMRSVAASGRIPCLGLRMATRPSRRARPIPLPRLGRCELRTLPTRQLVSDPASDVTYSGSVRVDLRDVWFGDAGGGSIQEDRQVEFRDADRHRGMPSSWASTSAARFRSRSSPTSRCPTRRPARLLRVHVGAVVVAPLRASSVYRSAPHASTRSSPRRKRCARCGRAVPTCAFFYRRAGGRGRDAQFTVHGLGNQRHQCGRRSGSSAGIVETPRWS